MTEQERNEALENAVRYDRSMRMLLAFTVRMALKGDPWLRGWRVEVAPRSLDVWVSLPWWWWLALGIGHWLKARFVRAAVLRTQEELRLHVRRVNVSTRTSWRW